MQTPRKFPKKTAKIYTRTAQDARDNYNVCFLSLAVTLCHKQTNTETVF